MEDLEREVPHGEDDDDGDQACNNENDDLLEPYVEREEHPLRARSPESVLQLHRRTLPPKPDNERLTRGQIPMDKRNDHGAFTHRRRQALDRRMAHVAGSEHARHACLEVIGLPVESPVGRQRTAAPEIGTGHEIPLLVANDADLRRPLRIGHAAEAEKEQVASTIRSSPVLRFLSVTACNRSSPCRAATSVLGSTSMLGVVWIRWTRYSDTFALRQSPRMTMVTFAA